MKITRLKLSELHLDPENARSHNEKNIEIICNSLDEFSQYQPLVVQESSMKIIAGNGRYVAMEQLGWTEAECVVLDISDKEATALALVDNRSSDLATWDKDALSNIVGSMPDDMAELIGFSQGDLKNILGVNMDKFPLDDNGGGSKDVSFTAKLKVCPDCGHEW